MSKIKYYMHDLSVPTASKQMIGHGYNIEYQGWIIPNSIKVEKVYVNLLGS